MKNLLHKLKRRGNHTRAERRPHWRDEDEQRRMPHRGMAIWTPLDCYEFDRNLVRIDATMKGRDLK